MGLTFRVARVQLQVYFISTSKIEAKVMSILFEIMPKICSRYKSESRCFCGRRHKQGNRAMQKSHMSTIPQGSFNDSASSFNKWIIGSCLVCLSRIQFSIKITAAMLWPHIYSEYTFSVLPENSKESYFFVKESKDARELLVLNHSKHPQE